MIREHDECAPGRGRGRVPPARTAASPRLGAAASTRRAAPTVAMIDADLQYQPEDVLRLYRDARSTTASTSCRAGAARSGASKDQRYYISRGLQHAAQRARSAWTCRTTSRGFVVLRQGGHAGPPDVQGQLLLLAVVHHGGGPRQGLLVPGDRDALREPQAGHVVPRRARPASASLRSFDRPRQGRSGSTASTASRTTSRAQFLERHGVDDRRPAARAASTRCAGARTWRRFDQHALDDHARRRALLRDAQRRRSGCRRRRCASCRTRSSAAWSATPTAACRTTARACRSAKLRPEDIRGQADLHKLPFLTKDRRAQAPLLRHACRRTTHTATSSRSRPRVAPASRSSATPTARSSSSAGRPRCASQEWTGYRFGDPTRAALAPDARHVASRRSRKERADARAREPHVHPGLRDDRRQARGDDRD